MHFSSGPFLGDFFGKSDFLFTRSQSGFILDEERMVEVSVWLEAAWDNRTKARKLVAFYELFCITTLIGIFLAIFRRLGAPDRCLSTWVC